MRAQPAWIGGTVDAGCPVCLRRGAMPLVVETPLQPSARSAAAGTLRFARCPGCASVLAVGAPPPAYDSADPLDEVVQYYVEHLAAIDTVVDPLFALDRAGIRTYVEVGCSFGFAPDFGRRVFGWDVRGIDPSALAAAGRDALGLPIQAQYFTEDDPAGPPAADLLAASEVVEHVADPHAFMRAVIASLAPAGIVVMSTPNAAAVRPDTPHGALMQVLCPGYHLVLFSARALRGLVEAHGFLHHEVRETPTGLTIFAARQPFAFAPDGRTDRALYLQYLQGRLQDAPQGGPLECGMLYRLLREHAMFGQWDAAAALATCVVAAYAARGVDLAHPEACRPEAGADATLITFARRHPMNVGGVLYALAMMALLHGRDEARAVSLFDAAAVWLAAVRQVMAHEGITDAESDTFELLAAEQAMLAQAGHDPGSALARLDAILHGSLCPAADDPRIAAWQARLFVEAVNAGDHPNAARLFGAVASAGSGADAIMQVRRLLALGIHALNGRGDAAEARRWLHAALAAVAAAPGDPVLDGLGQAAAAALQVAQPALLPAPGPASRWPGWLRRGRAALRQRSR